MCYRIPCQLDRGHCANFVLLFIVIHSNTSEETSRNEASIPTDVDTSIPNQAELSRELLEKYDLQYDSFKNEEEDPWYRN